MSRVRLRAAVELVLGGVLVAAVLFAPARWVTGAALAALVLASLAPGFDLIDLLVRLLMRRLSLAKLDAMKSQGPRPRPARYAVVASIHDAAEDLDQFLASAAAYRHALWVIDDASADETVELLRMHGVPHVRATVNRKKPGALRELLKQLPPHIEAVVVLDPDTVLRSPEGGTPPLDSVLTDMLHTNRSAVCPRITVKRENLLTELQDLEYALSVALGRQALGEASVTSGISAYRRDDLEAMLESHSLSVYAEDLENTVRLLAAGRRIVLDDRLVAETEGKTRLRDLLSQRVGWAFGHIRVYWDQRAELREIAGRDALSAYQYVVYLGVIGIVLHPVRQIGGLVALASCANGLDALLGWGVVPDVAFTDPAIFVAVYLQYTTLAALALWTAVPAGLRGRTIRVVPLFVFYALFLAVAVTIGFVNWIAVRRGGRRVLDDHYESSTSLNGGRAAVKRPLPA